MTRLARPSVVLLCGPPGCGKSTYVHRHSQRGELVLDTDRLYEALSGRPSNRPTYDTPDLLFSYVWAARDAVLVKLREPSLLPRAWVIAGAPTVQERQRLRDDLHAKVVLFEVEKAECLRRIHADPQRGPDMREWKRRVERWWAQYEPGAADEVLR